MLNENNQACNSHIYVTFLHLKIFAYSGLKEYFAIYYKKSL